MNKLMSRGVPENEIAFIHDYDTAEKKQKLFDKMNNGDVRILLGSTAKCGAGMNAQKRWLHFIIWTVRYWSKEMVELSVRAMKIPKLISIVTLPTNPSILISSRSSKTSRRPFHRS